jgi:hypothetical protein
MGADDHRVAWKDRLEIKDVWKQNLMRCSECFRDDGYIDAVDCFRNNIININGGPALKDFIDDYVKGELKAWKNNHLAIWADDNKSDARVPEILAKTESEIDLKAHELLFHFIIQTLEDNGFCFYKSAIEMEEKMG